MKQYCRYCGFCIEVDSGYYCTDDDHLMTESDIKRVNVCKNYAYSEIGDIITGKHYRPRKPHKKHDCKQITFEEV